MDTSPIKTTQCVRCLQDKPLTFEHIPPSASGDNGPTRLYNMLEAIKSDSAPWDFRGRKYKNAQRGTGGYFLCSDCNSQTGRETVPAYLEMIRQSKAQNILPVELAITKSITWQVKFEDIDPHAIAQQIILMAACMNGSQFTQSRADIYRILNDNSYQPQAFPHGLYVFINAGALSVSYPVTALGGLNEGVTALTGVYAGTYSFHLQVDRRTNPFNYLDISHWISDYAYGARASFDLSIPVYQTNIGLPGAHATRQEMLRNRAEASK